MWDCFLIVHITRARPRRWLVLGGAACCCLVMMGSTTSSSSSMFLAHGWLLLWTSSSSSRHSRPRSCASRNQPWSRVAGPRHSPLFVVERRTTATHEKRSSSSITSSSFTTRTQNDPDGNILEDGTGHINRELAERIWNWEQERRRENNLPKVEYSVRSGLRLVDSTIDTILATRTNRGSSSSNDDGNRHWQDNNNNNNNSILRGELIQEGLFALLDAMSHYRQESHTEDFETYASREIHQHLAQTLQDNGRPLRLPNGIQSIVQQANRLMAQGWDGTRPTLAQVAAKLDISLHRLQDYLRLAKATGHTLSMESTVEIYNPLLDEDTPSYRDQEEFELREGMLLDDGRTVHRDELVDEYVDTSIEREGDDEAWIRQERIAAPLQEMIVDDEFPLPDELVLQEQERNRLYTLLSSTLDTEVLEVVRLYFGLDTGKALTVEEIAKQMDKTELEVLSWVEQALRELRAAYFESNQDSGVLEENNGQ